LSELVRHLLFLPLVNPFPNAGQSTMTTLTMTKELVNVAGASEVALDGFDPVAFFTDSKPVNGNFKITATHHGATYYFANKEHKKMFAKDPEKYAPQNGGFCTFGVSVGALFPVDINTWQVYNDKLYLNLNPDILEMFKKDMDGNIAKAANNWPGLVEKNAK
jgi:YHS domain-containing protein